MAPRALDILVFMPEDRMQAIFASGLLKQMHDEAPSARFSIVAGPKTAPLFRETPHLDALLVREGAGPAETLKLLSRLRERRWGFVLDAAGLAISGLAPARQRSRRRPGEEGAAHPVVQAARLLRLEDEPPPPSLFVGERNRQRAIELLGEGGPILAIAPSSGWIGRTWPVERFARTAVSLLADDGPLAGGRLMVTGAPDDRHEVEALRRAVSRDRFIDLTSKSDPLLLSACFARARLMLGGAFWTTHLAAAAGAPTLALFGPSDEAREGVWGPSTRVVRGPRSFQAIRAVDPGLDQPVCHMLDLKVETVLEAAAALFAATGDGEGMHWDG